MMISGVFSLVQNGCTALMFACVRRHDRIVQLLVDAGANKDMQNDVSYNVNVYVALSNNIILSLYRKVIRVLLLRVLMVIQRLLKSY